MDNNTLTLKSPVEHGGHKYTSLSMREPKVRDTVTAQEQSGTDAEVEVNLFANLCEVAPEVIKDMGMRDYKALQSIYKGFLS